MASEHNNLNKVIHIDSRDETGLMARCINIFIAQLKGAISDAKDSSHINQDYSVNMRNISEKTEKRVHEEFEIAQETIKQANSIQTIVEESSQNFQDTKENMQEAHSLLSDARNEIYKMLDSVHHSVELEHDMNAKLEQLSQEDTSDKRRT